MTQVCVGVHGFSWSSIITQKTILAMLIEQ